MEPICKIDQTTCSMLNLKNVAVLKCSVGTHQGGLQGDVLLHQRFIADIYVQFHAKNNGRAQTYILKLAIYRYLRFYKKC
jgi:hypothetical protein